MNLNVSNVFLIISLLGKAVFVKTGIMIKERSKAVPCVSRTIARFVNLLLHVKFASRVCLHIKVIAFVPILNSRTHKINAVVIAHLNVKCV